MSNRTTRSSAADSSSKEKGARALIVSVAVVAAIGIGALAWASTAGAPAGPAQHPAAGASSSSTAPSSPQPHSTPTHAAATSPAPTADGPTPSPEPPRADATSPAAAPDPRFGVPVATSVPVSEPATLSGGITAHIDSITPITAKATRAGEISGPALSIVVTLTNTTSSPVSLNQVSVGAYYGKDATPAGSITGEKDTSLHGALAPGASASGTYVFTVPKEQQSTVTLTVTDAAGAPIAVFH